MSNRPSPGASMGVPDSRDSRTACANALMISSADGPAILIKPNRKQRVTSDSAVTLQTEMEGTLIVAAREDTGRCVWCGNVPTATYCRIRANKTPSQRLDVPLRQRCSSNPFRCSRIAPCSQVISQVSASERAITSEFGRPRERRSSRVRSFQTAPIRLALLDSGFAQRCQ